MCCICNINKFTVDGFSVISDLIYFLVLPVGVLFRPSIVNVCGWGGWGGGFEGGGIYFAYEQVSTGSFGEMIYV